MTKRRAIYGSAATSISLARCCPEAQLLFDRLISQADDQGRLQGDPMLVRAQCMPLVDKATVRNVDRWLGELADNGMLIRYDANGQPLIQVVKWWEHQDWMRHVYPSRWPSPDGWDDRTKGSGAPKDADAAPLDDGEVPPNDGAMPAQNSGGVSGESESELEASASRDAREARTPPPPSDISLHKITTTHRDLFGKDANAKASKMYADVLRDLAHGNPDVLLRAMYWCWNNDRSEYGFVGRVKDRLKVAA